LSSKAITEARAKNECFKNPYNSSIKNQNCEKSPAKTPLILDFYNLKNHEAKENGVFC